MGLEVWIYAGLTKADHVEVDKDGYPRDWDRFWRAAVVEGTEYSYPRRAEGLEQDAIQNLFAKNGFCRPIKRDWSRQLIGCRMARDGHPNLSAHSISFQNAAAIPGINRSVLIDFVPSSKPAPRFLAEPVT